MLWGFFTDRQWFEFQRRGVSSLGQATKASDPQEEALISRSDDNVGGQGQTLPSQPYDGNLSLTSEEEVRKSFVLYILTEFFSFFYPSGELCYC